MSTRSSHDSIDWAGTLETEVSRISELARISDPQTPVVHLGRWKIRDVVAHLGGVHRWATRTIVARSRNVQGPKKSKLEGADLCDWFDESAAELIDALHGADLDDECPNFNPGSANTVEWWARRQTHETTVHRWDIERALSCTTPIDAKLASDGIDEFLDVFIRTRGKQTLLAPLHLTTNEPARSWMLTPATKPGRVDISPGAPSGDHPAIIGPPEQLLLYLWGRIGLDATQFLIAGDEAVAHSLKHQPPA